MAKAYILTEADFERLRLRLGQDQNRGLIRIDEAKRALFNEAHRGLVYEVETWIAEVQK